LKKRTLKFRDFGKRYNKWIIPFLSVGKRGFKSNFDLASIFLLILKRIKLNKLTVRLIMRYEYLG